MNQNLTETGVLTADRHVALVPVSARDKQGIIDLWKVLIEKVVLEQKHEVETNNKKQAAKSNRKASKSAEEASAEPKTKPSKAKSKNVDVAELMQDRKSVVMGKCVTVIVDIGGGRSIKKTSKI